MGKWVMCVLSSPSASPTARGRWGRSWDSQSSADAPIEARLFKKGRGAHPVTHCCETPKGDISLSLCALFAVISSSSSSSRDSTLSQDLAKMRHSKRSRRITPEPPLSHVQFSASLVTDAVLPMNARLALPKRPTTGVPRRQSIGRGPHRSDPASLTPEGLLFNCSLATKHIRY